MAIKNAYLQKVYDKVVARDPDQALFHRLSANSSNPSTRSSNRTSLGKLTA